jgi:flagellin
MNAVSLTSGINQNLFSLQRTSKLLSFNATRLNTGRKINSALEDPFNFFSSIHHMNRAKDLIARKAEMGEGTQTIQAALHPMELIRCLI